MSDSKWNGKEDKQKILYGNDYHTRRIRDVKDRRCKVKRANTAQIHLAVSIVRLIPCITYW